MRSRRETSVATVAGVATPADGDRVVIERTSDVTIRGMLATVLGVVDGVAMVRIRQGVKMPPRTVTVAVSSLTVID